MLHRLARIAVLIAIAAAVAAGPSATAAEVFPAQIDLPPGFRPEGISIGPGTTFYVGSIPTGAIYRGDLRTGQGAVLTPGSAGSASIGLDLDGKGRLFVAGGPTGQARVIDARTGEVLHTRQLASSLPTFVNDVVVARDAAWFTDSVNQVLYRVPLDLGPTQTVPITGDLVYQEPGFDVNGIDATPNGKTLILVQSNTGELFTADPATGVTRQIDLGGETVPAGDGILLHGKRLFVVRNTANEIAVVGLAPDFASGAIVDRFGDPGFDVPTTIDRFGNRLYAVNARFRTPIDPAPPYWVTQVPRG
jgi:sugar lactone lactonase YvrE